MFFWILAQVLFSGIIVLGFATYYFFLLPPKYPLNISAVPFWVTIIPFFRDVDQEDTYRKYIENPLTAHGAIKIFFAARWNIIVQRPLYIAEVFKDEEAFQKTGNQKRIPHSGLANFLGDNIISARGPEWKLYQSIVRPALQKNFETAPLFENAAILCSLVNEFQVKAGGNGIVVQELLQRYTIANVSNCLLQTDFQTLTDPNAKLNMLQSEVKKKIFQPIFLSFPFLDRDIIPSRKEARLAVARFSEELATGLTRSHVEKTCTSNSESLGSRLTAARQYGQITEKQFYDNLNVSFFAGQENPQLALTSTMYLLGKHQEIQARLRDEISSVDSRMLSKTFQELPYLTSVIYECLRLFPPISQLINRRISTDVLLGGEILIPKNTFVGYNSYSTNRDKSAWGLDADTFRLERWGTTSEEICKHYRKVRARAEFISFHGGKRACLGEKFAMLKLRISLVELVQRFEWVLDEMWEDRKPPVSFELHLGLHPSTDLLS
ncbi:cytochrome P450 [Halenospora varia]|nr:cytochrome P450 [Halenospora varia]